VTTRREARTQQLVAPLENSGTIMDPFRLLITQNALWIAACVNGPFLLSRHPNAAKVCPQEYITVTILGRTEKNRSTQTFSNLTGGKCSRKL
jgi:hypothetical protein